MNGWERMMIGGIHTIETLVELDIVDAVRQSVLTLLEKVLSSNRTY